MKQNFHYISKKSYQLICLIKMWLSVSELLKNWVMRLSSIKLIRWWSCLLQWLLQFFWCIEEVLVRICWWKRWNGLGIRFLFVAQRCHQWMMGKQKYLFVILWTIFKILLWRRRRTFLNCQFLQIYHIKIFFC